jgi:DNA-directed RNA polymerase specialized sigma24 family protein
MMKIYPWIEECHNLQKAGTTYEELSSLFGVSTGALAAALYRFRNPEYKPDAVRRAKAAKRVLIIIKRRKFAAQRALAPERNAEQDRGLIEAYAEGLTYEECGKRFGRSSSWAHQTLKKYGLDANERFSRKIRDFALQQQAGNPSI